ncbi:MAG: UDP-N-acetylmuramoyl-tripeptide--D-alanyl-D-alanine ligase [bacterium]|nr:UDP-N-acetylmuramoyl-tripeptide--D-alanyl-D-alanine ligase [bacterium]
MHPVKLIKFHLYLFQLENYNVERFLSLVLRKYKPTSSPRKQLVWTPKLILIFILAVLMQVALVFLFAILNFQAIFLILLICVLPYCYFVFLIASLILIYPIDLLVKISVVNRAKRKIQKFKNLKIIGVTGSYGKTTMKEVLGTVLRIKYRVLSTPDSVNTLVGIGRLILEELSEQTEIFIVEMGAYKLGEIRKLCKLTQPAIAILTGINEAHLERFGSLQNTIAAKFEIVENSASDALVVLNEDNKLITKNYQHFIGGRDFKFYSTKTLSRFETSLLGDYAKGTVNAAEIIARKLGLDDEQISRGISQIKPVPHRLEPIHNKQTDILVIDDSYSGNPEGAAEAIKVLKSFKDRRKIYITPGLVEMGKAAREIHLEIGRQLAEAADVVILIKNSVTPFIEEGIVCAPKDIAKIIWFENAKAAHAALPQILKRGDVILFQNDWPENYV